MTQYQKIATIAFRVMAVIAIISSLFSLIGAFIFSLPSMEPIKILIVFLPYAVGAVCLFFLSKLLAKLVCFDFDKTDEK
jgi:hypothetical protein